MSGTRRVLVHKNEPDSVSFVMMVKGSNFAKFKRDAGKKLGVKVKRVFLEGSGSEIMGVDEMQPDDRLYVSSGEPFFKDSGDPVTETMHVSVLGSGGVGKSALTLRFVRDFFIDHWDPTIEDAYRKTVEVDGHLCLLEILDTAGQDDFESLRPQWMMDKDGYIFVYTMDKEESLEELQPFFDLHEQINEGKTVPILVVANKKDLVDADPSCCEVKSERGKEVAMLYGGKYIETSALNGEGVVDAFEMFVRSVRESRGHHSHDGKGAEPEERKFPWAMCNIL